MSRLSTHDSEDVGSDEEIRPRGPRMLKPIVALVGRPNVGKSTLFNRLVGRRLAITEDEPGTTRDRMYADADWNGREFTLVDTGGLDNQSVGDIEVRVQQQARAAIQEADLIVFLVDAASGLVTADWAVADILRRTKKPVLLAANKAENQSRQLLASEFYELAIGEPIVISANHGMGTGDLLDAVVQSLPDAPLISDMADDTIQVAIIGRPNVGKSSLLNAVLGQDRVIVSDIPGTTRDSIDTLVDREGHKFLFIDTAGIRRRGRIEPGVEKHSVMRSLRAVNRSDVTLLVVDAVAGLTEGDLHIAGFVQDDAKGLIVVVNKWDLIEKDTKTADAFSKIIRQRLDFMDYAPVLYISAVTRQRVHRIFDEVLSIQAEREKRVPTAQLNNFVEQVQQRHVPTSRGKALRIYYATQAGVRPPTFVFFVNDPRLVHFSYVRHLENELRRSFSFRGTPIRITIRGKPGRET